MSDNTAPIHVTICSTTTPIHGMSNLRPYMAAYIYTFLTYIAYIAYIYSLYIYIYTDTPMYQLKLLRTIHVANAHV